MTCVFISYSSIDRKLAEQIHAELSQLGYGVWRDQKRLELDWPREISQALVHEADLLCLALCRFVWKRTRTIAAVPLPTGSS
ncbi:MAG: toll/interleukin-1 receptor domain-containing protein [Candidatus Accumulibacter sp.]|uniref:Toll/interleukin-1 receptor domain-containing protein n=1 Tax=Candidatus Accumulibacter proximus TaxID=2954385 RepID=A0A935UI00_9PROT|nr:toll/interleukin-1 receptor domain-containing protein [Candidatus Accumulibacter proximus]